MTSSKSITDRARKRRGALRVAAYLAVLSIFATCVSIRNARAEVADQALELGRQMHQLTGATGEQSERTRVLINGQAVLVGSAVSEDRPSVVLDRFEAHCRKNLAQNAESWHASLSKDGNTEAESEASYFDTGVLRTGSDDGVIVCFTKTNESAKTVKEAIDAFTQTGNLNAFGALRFAYVKPTSRGQSHVLTVWTEESFDFRKIMFEEGKDVGGEDFAEIPRPPSSTRLLATRIDNQPYGVNVYVTQVPPSDVAKFYDEVMERSGWTVFNPRLDEAGGDPGRSYERDGIVLTLHASSDSGRTFAALGLAGVAARDAIR